jgi:RNA methyltransferase, TrmH family
MNTDILTSRDNPWVKQCRALAQDGTAYRKAGQVWLEGDHLARALLARGGLPSAVVLTESRPALADGWPLPAAVRRVVVADRLMAWISGLDSPPPVACLYDLPPQSIVHPDQPTVVLDRLQDPGNVGSILRSAAAFGFRQVLALKGTAALWSPKVLRAGMGAHFGLHLLEGLDAEALKVLHVPLVATSSHQGAWLHQADVPWPCAWLLGHEGQGLSDALMTQAAHHVRIAQPGGEESLNVAAAAAICLHASACRQGANS